MKKSIDNDKLTQIIYNMYNTLTIPVIIDYDVEILLHKYEFMYLNGMKCKIC